VAIEACRQDIGDSTTLQGKEREERFKAEEEEEGGGRKYIENDIMIIIIIGQMDPQGGQRD